jgi:hypothetical protein
MAWCEENSVRNDRWPKIGRELKRVQKEYAETRAPSRRFKKFSWTTRNRWSRRRREVGKSVMGFGYCPTGHSWTHCKMNNEPSQAQTTPGPRP